MKRNIICLVLILSCALTLPPSTLSTTPQSLDWGISLGERFDYQMLMDSFDFGGYNESFYLTIENISLIPDTISDFYGLGNVSFDAFWENETSMGLSILFLAFTPKIAVPIGNWTLLSYLALDLQEVFLSDIESVEVTYDDLYRWGFTYVIDYSPYTYEIDVVYSKKDGMLAKLSFLEYYGSSDNYDASMLVYRDGVPPLITHPSDIEMNEGDLGSTITWKGTDNNPGAFEIYETNLTGSYLLQQCLWNSSDEDIIYEFGSLAYGNHTFTIVVHEISGLSSFDSVTVVVNDIEPPSITHPNDLVVTYGELGRNFTWILEDMNPEYYRIYRDGTLIDSGYWHARVASITVNLDDLNVGEHIYNITIEDKVGNIASDSVIVTVVPDFLNAYLPYIISTVGIVGLVLMGAYFYRQRKRNLQ